MQVLSVPPEPMFKQAPAFTERFPVEVEVPIEFVSPPKVSILSSVISPLALILADAVISPVISSPVSCCNSNPAEPPYSLTFGALVVVVENKSILPLLEN